MKKITAVLAFSLMVSVTAFSQWYIQTTLPTGAEYNRVGFANREVGWISRMNGEVYKTTNGGQSWFRQETGTTNPLATISVVDQSNVWISGYYGTVLRTTNGGALWEIQPTGVQVNLPGSCFVDKNHGWVSGDLGTILWTTNGGTQWNRSESITTKGITAISFADTMNGLAAGDPSTILRTTDGGRTWKAQQSPVTTRFNDVHYIDTAHAWIAGGDWITGSGAMLMTSDGGAHWTTSSVPSTQYFSVRFVNAKTGWAGGRNGTLIKTTDGGFTWTRENSPSASWIVSLSFIDSTIGWAVEPGGNVLQMKKPDDLRPPFRILSIKDLPNDQGKSVIITWRTFEKDPFPPFTAVNYSLWRRDSANIWTYLNTIPSRRDSVLAVVAPTIYNYTKANGIRWSVFQLTAHGSYSSQIAFSAVDSGYSVDNLAPSVPAGVMAKSSGSNLELSWKKSSDEDFSHYAVYRSSQSNFDPGGKDPYRTTADTLFVDTGVTTGPVFYYRISAVDRSGNESEWSSEIRSDRTSIVGKIIPAVFSCSQNFPNPFNPSTTITYSIAEESHVTLTIFDALGRVLLTPVNEFKTEGMYNATVDAGTLSAGVYFYALRAGNFSAVKKMQLIK